MLVIALSVAGTILAAVTVGLIANVRQDIDSIYGRAAVGLWFGTAAAACFAAAIFLVQ